MREHVRACASCRRALEGDEALTASLAALARADETFEPAAGLERGVLAAWDRRGLRDRAGSTLPAAAAAVLAMAALAAFLIVRLQPDANRIDLPPADARTAALSGPRQPPAPAPRERAEIPPVEVNSAADRTRPAGGTAPVRTSAPRETAGDRDVVTFVPLWPGDPVADGPLQLMRVRLSRASLAGFGLPIDELGTDANLQADVLVGEDGVARAIRLVPFD
jgi:hypothetical protein